MLLKRTLRTPLSQLQSDLNSKVCGKQEAQCAGHNKRAKTQTFVPGDKVYTHSGGPKLSWVAGTINEVTGPVSYVVHLNDGRSVRRHVDHICRRYADTAPPDLVELETFVAKPAEITTPTLLPPITDNTPSAQPESPIPTVETPSSVPAPSVTSPSPELQGTPELRRSDRIRRAPKRWEE